MTDAVMSDQQPPTSTPASTEASHNPVAPPAPGTETAASVQLSECGISKVKHIVLVLSGKGGVGKSTIACQLAFCFRKAGARVGVLDIDLCGPSVPRIMGVADKSVLTSSKGWVPVFADDEHMLSVVSMAFLTEEANAPVIWRGPRKNAAIKSFLEDVCWGPLDVMIIDTPPGTSDEHISICEFLHEYHPDGAVLVTTPQIVSVNDVRKEISFCNKIGLPILGLVENMSGYVCPHCSTTTNIFSSEGGRLLSEECHIPFIGKIPIDPVLCACEESGSNPFVEHPDLPSLSVLVQFSREFLSRPARSSS
ncbi:cytosolic Fe-S cluster assembly factor Cfd1 [Pelomyxa schiedti]|nr:cytosolic Fe-S cluster assembly factor Cfd1 [Pelomyxa schiedti]